MLFADVNGVRVSPAGTGNLGHCPQCSFPVIAKCGEYVAWHWAHESRADCDTWAEPAAMTPWHRGWQEAAPADRREVSIGGHRADVVLPDGTVCEVQHSPIGGVDVLARQETYGVGMLWIFDARGVHDRGEWHTGHSLSTAPTGSDRSSTGSGGNGATPWAPAPPRRSTSTAAATGCYGSGVGTRTVCPGAAGSSLARSWWVGSTAPRTRPRVPCRLAPPCRCPNPCVRPRRFSRALSGWRELLG